ncbi:hypothetical protein AGDE_02478 [Angomonas deanei]|nr:hypothetical protein AGDE_11786 [Angomonas deanei]EPY41446.1 hypothetical protein AGDE_02478 [Angomonas deanei]|eukprot:EPY25421.1 hypothetical protein AGDE_11786 [Angomonas deanei]
MEAERGVWYPTRHADMMMEKSNLMEFMLAEQSKSSSTDTPPMVAFLDSDITLLNPLPQIPSRSSVVLSPHYIRKEDELLFGRYNGGFVATSDPSMLFEWRKFTQTSRFFDQASLEAVAEQLDSKMLYELPPQDNYGFWRFTQNPSGCLEKEAAKFSIELNGENVRTLCYDGVPLRSVHTHFCTAPEAARDVRLFNNLILGWVAECASESPGENGAYKKALGPLFKKI